MTGAGRGIGLALCRLLIGQDYIVLACPRRRDTSQELAELSRLHEGRLIEIPMDVAQDSSVTAAAHEVGAHTGQIDLLINNAGVFVDRNGSIEDLDLQNLSETFEINAVGPLRVVKACLPLLRQGQGKRVTQITSLMGSIGDNRSGGAYAYRMSKAALNMATRNLARDLEREGFVVLAIHPGWVLTRMGGSSAPLGVIPAAEEILRTALGTRPQESGAFKGPGGKVLPY